MTRPIVARRLLAAASPPPPWIRPWAALNVRGIGAADVLQKQANLDLAVYAVNRLPDYEAAVEALERLADAATALENRAVRSGGEFHVWAEERMVTDARDEARAALRRLREQVPA